MDGKTVLVIEDNELNMMLASKLLESGKYRVLAAYDAGTGIQMAQAHLPDLILMDLQLPDMDGLSATRRIKENPETYTIPVIALTGYDTPQDRQAAFDAGCIDYLSKPLDPTTFLETVTGCLCR
jgi:two-component system, cell cycle response regulator DivK